MTVTIHQPDFAPWLGFFQRWRRSGLLVLLDDAQFIKGGWHNRDQIRGPDGPQWLTVPVLHSGHFAQPLRDVMIDPKRPWRRKHLGTLRNIYGRSPGFTALFPKLEAIYGREQESLVEFNVDLLRLLAAELGISTPLAYASEYGIQAEKNERLIRLVKRTGGDTYLTGSGSRSYLDVAAFEREGIRVTFHTPAEVRDDYDAPDPELSALDYLFHHQAAS